MFTSSSTSNSSNFPGDLQKQVMQNSKICNIITQHKIDKNSSYLVDDSWNSFFEIFFNLDDSLSSVLLRKEECAIPSLPDPCLDKDKTC